MNSKSLDTNAPEKTTDIITAEMLDALNMKKIEYFPMHEQYSNNCSWSSSAKCVLWSALFFRLYQAAKNLDPVQSVSEVNRKAKAREQSLIYSKIIKKLWSHFDLHHNLEAYIKQTVEPSPILLAYILMKNPHNKDFVRMINETQLVTRTDTLKATAMADRLVTNLLQKELGEDDYKSILSAFPLLLEEIIIKLRDLYIYTRKSNVERVFSSLEFRNDRESLQTILNVLTREMNAPESYGMRPDMFFNHKLKFDPVVKKDDYSMNV